MSDSTHSYVPAELVGGHYRSIGGSFASLALAIEATEHHFRNGHGGGGSFQVFRPDNVHDTAALIEAGSADGNPMAVRAVYKILVAGPPQ